MISALSYMAKLHCNCCTPMSALLQRGILVRLLALPAHSAAAVPAIRPVCPGQPYCGHEVQSTTRRTRSRCRLVIRFR